MHRISSTLSLGRSPIGLTSMFASRISCVVALGILAVDMTFAPTIGFWERVGLAGIFLAVCASTERPFSPAALGLTLRPVLGWRWWLTAGAILGVILALFCLGLYVTVHSMNNPLGFRSMFVSREEVWPFLVSACVRAPIAEEAIYRLVACVAFKPVIGARLTVLITGIWFSLLHVRYGNPGIDNATAGFLLAWVFLKSGSIAVPILFHMAGNAVIIALHSSLIYHG